MVKNPLPNAGDCLQCRRPGCSPWKIPCRWKWQPTSVFLPGKSLGQRSLVGYNPQCHTRVEHDLVTEQQQFIILTEYTLPSTKIILLSWQYTGIFTVHFYFPSQYFMLLSNAALYYVINSTVHCHYYLKQFIIKEIFLNKEIIFLFVDILCPILFISFCRLKMIIFLLPKAFFFLLFLAVLLRWWWILSSFVCVVSCISGNSLPLAPPGKSLYV